MGWFGPKSAGHLGGKCVICGEPFAVGDRTGLIPVRPADDKERGKKAQGRFYTAEAVEAHKSCIREAAQVWAENEGQKE